MRTIQEVGTEILNNTPQKLYIFGGEEYGIKCKYISILKEHYSICEEMPTVNSVISIMSRKHFIPLQPKLYVVRYDEEFISNLNEVTASKLKSLNVIGTLVCIYESVKHVNKLEKYLPDYTVQIDKVNPQFVVKYLHSDFPKLPDRLINLAATYGSNYSEAQTICCSMSAVPAETLFSLSDIELMKMFNKYDDVSESNLKVGIASRNFTYLVNLLEQYNDIDSIFYTILSTMLDLEKVLTNTYAESPLREYAKRWTLEDVYNMFMNTYEALKNSRSSRIQCDTSYIILYLFSLLKFQQIPDVNVMEESI